MVFVVGAAGAIGRRVVPLLRTGGRDGTAAGRSRGRPETLRHGGAPAVPFDLLDRSRVRDAIAGHDAAGSLATSVPRGTRGFLPGAWRATTRSRRDGAGVALRFAMLYDLGDPFTSDRPVSARRGRILGAPLERRAPRRRLVWVHWLGGSYGETIGRSLRISNAKLKRESTRAPRLRSVHAGMRPALAPTRQAADQRRPNETEDSAGMRVLS